MDIIERFRSTSEALELARKEQASLAVLREEVASIYVSMDESVSQHEEQIDQRERRIKSIIGSYDAAEREYAILLDKLPRTQEQDQSVQVIRDNLSEIAEQHRKSHRQLQQQERAAENLITEMNQPNRRHDPRDPHRIESARK
ncbi:MAG: hypothetical protein GY904_07275 [Planctomycetaceae bacterium]|nr:hypothetical protein [Planctomycetaceae bacterium]